MEYIALNNNIKIPTLGIGAHHLDAGSLCEQYIEEAISTGFRYIETATSFWNEKSVGIGIKNAIDKGSVNREDLFISTKLRDDMQGYENTRIAFLESAETLGGGGGRPL